MIGAFTRIFVYGTLKNGQPNYHFLDYPGKSKFVKTARTAENYPLVIATKFNIPFMLQVPGQGEQVLGEIYDVDDEILANLDLLEGHPEYYLRQPIALENIDGTPISGKILCYLLPQGRFPQHLLSYPTMNSYDSLGSHGRPYIVSSTNEEEYDDPDLMIAPTNNQ